MGRTLCISRILALLFQHSLLSTYRISFFFTYTVAIKALEATFTSTVLAGFYFIPSKEATTPEIGAFGHGLVVLVIDIDYIVFHMEVGFFVKYQT